MASAKTAVRVSSLTLVPWTANPSDWTTILGSANASDPKAVTIKMPAQKDLIFSVSLECGLYTRTLVKSKGGITDASLAMASVRGRIVLDPGGNSRVADPGEITFGRRTQELTAKLQGIIGNLACFPDGVFDPNATGCILDAEEIGLTLTTVNANAFFFALSDVGSGTHNVIVQARIDMGTEVQAGEAEARALVGKGALIVDDVRLIKSGIIDLS